MISPVFKQNLYSGVFEDLAPEHIPEDINFFKFDEAKAEKYPLFAEVQEYLLFGRVEKGDCIYIPAFWWIQNQTESKESTYMTFGYETSNMLAHLLFTAIDHGILDQDE